jgi:hypothetical protein
MAVAPKLATTTGITITITTTDLDEMLLGHANEVDICILYIIYIL